MMIEVPKQPVFDGQGAPQKSKEESWSGSVSPSWILRPERGANLIEVKDPNLSISKYLSGSISPDGKTVVALDRASTGQIAHLLDTTTGKESVPAEPAPAAHSCNRVLRRWKALRGRQWPGWE